MKSSLVVLAAFVLATVPVIAADENPDVSETDVPAATPDPHAKLKVLVGRINEKLKAAGEEVPDLSAELKEFDELIAGFKEDEKVAAAQATFMKGMLYIQVLKEPEKAREVFATIPEKFPGSKEAGTASEILPKIDMQIEMQKKQDALAEGSDFPNFEVTGFDGKPVSVAALKGNVVLVDFWATWCGPCMIELPELIAAYEKYHSQGFEILGISLDKDREALTNALKENAMPWPQVLNEKGGDTDLANKYGVTAIPATFLLDREGRIIAKNLRGKDLEAAIARAVGASDEKSETDSGN